MLSSQHKSIQQPRRMFPTDFGLRHSLKIVDHTLLKYEDYNLPDIFGEGILLTPFNTFDVDVFLTEDASSSLSGPKITGDPLFERFLLAYEHPPYSTPCPSPAMPLVFDIKTRRKVLSTCVDASSVKLSLLKLPRNLKNRKTTCTFSNDDNEKHDNETKRKRKSNKVCNNDRKSKQTKTKEPDISCPSQVSKNKSKTPKKWRSTCLNLKGKKKTKLLVKFTKY